MASVPGQHGATPRLRQVANKQSGPTRDLVHLVRKALEQLDHVRMGPIAVAGQPHHLPSLSINGQCLSTCETTFCIKPDGMHGQRSRQDFARKEFFCAKVRIIGIGQWWERFGVDATFVLCRSGAIEESRIFSN